MRAVVVDVLMGPDSVTTLRNIAAEVRRLQPQWQADWWDGGDLYDDLADEIEELRRLAANRRTDSGDLRRSLRDVQADARCISLRADQMATRIGRVLGGGR